MLVFFAFLQSNSLEIWSLRLQTAWATAVAPIISLPKKNQNVAIGYIEIRMILCTNVRIRIRLSRNLISTTPAAVDVNFVSVATKRREVGLHVGSMRANDWAFPTAARCLHSIFRHNVPSMSVHQQGCLYNRTVSIIRPECHENAEESRHQGRKTKLKSSARGKNC